jgi:hypothetical protein
MFQTKGAEKIKTHILCSVFLLFFFFENRAVYEIMWKNIAESDRPQMAIWRTRIACWIRKATDTYSEYVILIPFPLQQWLRERTSMFRYTYPACLVFNTSCPCQMNSERTTSESHMNTNSRWRSKINQVKLCSYIASVIIIIIIIFINCSWVDTRWQWLFYMYTKYDIGYY